jgi:mannose-6-phosphate isomerase-like protein (cupin superfamily)
VGKPWMFCLMLFLVSVFSWAQEGVPEGFEHWTADSLRELQQTVKTEAASSPQHLSVRRLKDFPNEWFMFGQRQADGAVEWHETQADIFFVQSGSATLLVGGTMVGGQTTEPHEKRGGTIQGGTRVKLSPGDIVRIPAKVPHQVLLEGAPDFTFFIVKVKGY